jgi:hypothetical protein
MPEPKMFIKTGTRRSRFALIIFLVVAAIFVVLVKHKIDFDSLQKTTMTEEAQTKVAFDGSDKDIIAHNKNVTTTKKHHHGDLNCTWTFPKNNNNNNVTSASSSCFNHLVQRIQSTTTRPVTRWIFAGDSTMYRLFHDSPLHENLIQTFYKPPCPNYSCHTLKAGRCQTGKFFDITTTRVVEHWQPPNTNNQTEGPVGYGLDHPYCKDCMACDSVLLHCLPDFPSSCKRRMIPTGGYLSVEYARDVEVQSTSYRSTQEHFAKYLEPRWNTPIAGVVRDLGRPVCVVSTGIHDAKIPNINLNDYISNVKDYIRLLTGPCAHLVWLGNTSPETNDYVQTKEQTERWNQAVLDLLRSNDPLWNNNKNMSVSSSFVGVFEASTVVPHADNIHMNHGWYNTLGTMLMHLIQELDDATHRRISVGI